MPSPSWIWSPLPSHLLLRAPFGWLMLVSLSGAVGGCAEEQVVGSSSVAVVYGEDDRTEVYAHPNAALRELATQSIVALMPSSSLFDNGDGTVWIEPGPTLGEAFVLCDDQRFVEQPTHAFCSGTLVAPDIVLTAGHCFRNAAACDLTRFPDETTSFVFDYLYTADGVLSEIEFDDVYHCVEILAVEEGALDYAYVRLDRPVVGHTPATLSTGIGDTCRNVEDDDAVAVLGFGSGLPLKIDDGGNVTDPSTQGSYFFETSLDTFGGNSGSGVFNDDGELVGVLSSGAADYAVRATGKCREVIVLPERAGTEVIGHLLPTLSAYCESADVPDDDLCAVFRNACPDGLDPGPDPEPEPEPEPQPDRSEDGSSCSVSTPRAGWSPMSLALVMSLGLVLGRRARRQPRGAA